MRLKDGFVLRDVCGEKVIMGEGVGALDFGHLLCLNETAAWLWEKAGSMGDFTVEALAEAALYAGFPPEHSGSGRYGGAPCFARTLDGLAFQAVY